MTPAQQEVAGFHVRRASKPETLGVVVSGGGQKGLYCYGTMLAMERVGLLAEVDFFIGASAGTLMSILGCVSLMKTGSLQHGAEVLAKVRKPLDIYEPEAQAAAGFILGSAAKLVRCATGIAPVASLCDPAGLRALLKAECGELTAKQLFEATGKQVWAVGTDYHTGETLMLGGDDKLWMMGMASSALPVIFPPVDFGDGRVVQDGGIFANHPAAQALELGASKLAMLYCGPDPCNATPPLRNPNNMLDTAAGFVGNLLDRAEATAYQQAADQEARRAAEGQPVEVLSFWPQEDTGGLLDFGRPGTMRQGFVDGLALITPEALGAFLV